MASKTIQQKLANREREVFSLAEGIVGSTDGVELDEFCAVSEGGDNGAYVQAWMWVPFGGTKLCKDKHSGSSEDMDRCPYDNCPGWGKAKPA